MPLKVEKKKPLQVNGRSFSAMVQINKEGKFVVSGSVLHVNVWVERMAGRMEGEVVRLLLHLTFNMYS